MAKTGQKGVPAIGGSSLLVIFAVLCLSVFAMLSVSTVLADGRLAEKTEDFVSGYYRADCQAEEILAELRVGKIPEGVQQDGERYSYRCPITSSQSLLVEVQVQGEDYEILRWQSVFTEEWKADQFIQVWDGRE